MLSEADIPEPESLDNTDDEEDSPLADVPGLDDWLSTEDTDTSDSTDAEAGVTEDIYDELDSEDFDELLESLEADTPSEEPASDAEQVDNLNNQPLSEQENIEAPDAQSEADTSQEEDTSLQLDNPDLDLAALLNDVEPAGDEGEARTPPEDFLDVDALMDEGGEEGDIDPDTAELDLDVSLSEFTGVNDTDAVIDIDKDAGQNANLDLARVYIEMDDFPAAKELLDEVLSQGSEEQKQEAESILKSIS